MHHPPSAAAYARADDDARSNNPYAAGEGMIFYGHFDASAGNPAP